MRTISMLLAGALLLTLAACQGSSSSSRSEELANGTAGEQMSQICFTRNIRSWHELDSQTIVVRANVDDYYRLELSGGCDGRNAFTHIEVRSRSGSCLGVGDEVSFDRDFGPSCTIRRINRWHLADTES